MDTCVKKLPQNTKAYFIKLGVGGGWEEPCLANGTLRFGYRDTPHGQCLNGEWEKVHELWTKVRGGNVTTASNDTRQIKTFYEADENAIFITFFKGCLWWCHPKGAPKIHVSQDGTRVRKTVDGWKNASLGGELLSVSRLSGKLTKTQMYRGTICDVKEKAYLLRRINDEKTPELAAVEETEKTFLVQILAMIRLLDPRDFELMVELIFSNSGWQRQSWTGGSQRTIDVDLRLPSTGETAFVQVKSETDDDQFDEYANYLAGTDAHARMFYVWHSGAIDRRPPSNITLWGPDVIASKVLEAGLLRWLKDRVA